MDILVKGCTVVMVLIISLAAIIEIKKDCEPKQLYPLFLTSILVGIPFGRVWGFW